MNNVVNRIFGTRSNQAQRNHQCDKRRSRAVKPGVSNLEDRQLLSAFASNYDGTQSRGGQSVSDMAVYRPSNSTWNIAMPGTGFSTSPQSTLQIQWGTAGDIPILNTDFFGNGHADLAVFRPTNATWYIKDPITNKTLTVQWGQTGDVPLPHSDFDGDGKADIAVWRPSTGTWFVLKSSTGYDPNQRIQIQWGVQGDVPIASSDYDGDGKTDLSIYRPSTNTWFILTSSSNYNSNNRIQVQWGVQGDVPILNSDFDGDHKADIAVYRPSSGTWFVLKSSTGFNPYQRLLVQLGTPGDIPISGSDFDGDGKTDIAIYRPSSGTWSILKSSTGFDSSQPLQIRWGIQGDIPLSNMDFDGDGKSDLAVFRPMDGSWHVLTSSSSFSLNSRIERAWGAAGDEPIGGPAAASPLANVLGTSISTGTNAPGIVYASFQGNPVFASDGPKPEDVVQGNIGDCDQLAALVGIAKDDPALLRSCIIDMGSGLYAVDFKPLGVDRYIVVDATLPVYSNGAPVYAQLGHQNSLWVALMEKAFTFERSSDPTVIGTYGVDTGGGSFSITTALGCTYYGNVNYNASTPDALWMDAVLETSRGEMVTVSTFKNPRGGGLVESHMYFVDSINYAWSGTSWNAVSMTLRNPWGGANEFITISETTFDLNMYSATWTNV